MKWSYRDEETDAFSGGAAATDKAHESEDASHSEDGHREPMKFHER